MRHELGNAQLVERSTAKGPGLACLLPFFALVRYGPLAMKRLRLLATALLILATALGSGAYVPQAAAAPPATEHAGGADASMAGVPTMDAGQMDASMAGMPAMDESATGHCDQCVLAGALYACGAVCTLHVVLPTAIVAVIAAAGAAYGGALTPRFSGSTPLPDPHPPRLTILA